MPVAPMMEKECFGPLLHISLLRWAFQGFGSQATVYQVVSGEERS
jgi:hypothetical protein